MNQAAKNEPSTDGAAIAQRNAVVREWVQSLRSLRARLTGNAAQAIAEGTLYDIEECASLGLPITNSEGEWGLRYLDLPDGGFAIVPLFEKDGNIHPYFSKQLSGPSYQETCRAIFLPPDGLSETWQALILVHEVNHAMRHQDRLYRSLELDHWIEEYETYIEEIELVEEIYGQSYIETISKLSQEFEEQLNTGRFHLETGKQVSNDLLESIFGKAESKLEANMQRGVVILNALYRALDRLHPDGSKHEHYTITEWFTTSTANKNM